MSNQNEAAIARLAPNGAYDATFNQTGIQLLDLGASNEDAYDIDLQRDGRIVIAGHTQRQEQGATRNKLVVARLSESGQLDTAFGTPGQNGKAVVDFFPGSQSLGYAITVLPDNRIVAAGKAYTNNQNADGDMAVALLTENGSPDNSFGESGVYSQNIGGNDQAEAIAIQGDEIVTANYNGSNFVLVRLHTSPASSTTASGSFQANFKFGKDNSAGVPGYITDIGNGYRTTGSNGYNYGWINPADNDAAVQNTGSVRDSAEDVASLTDSYISTYKGATPLSWKVAVPNGTYLVTLTAGRADVTSGTFRYGVENDADFLRGPPARATRGG